MSVISFDFGSGYNTVTPQMYVPTNAYKVETVNCEEHEKEGRKSLKFEVVIDEGHYKGALKQTYVGLSKGTKNDFNEKMLTTAFVSHGFPQDRLKGAQNFDTVMFKGKKAYVWIQAAPEGEMDEQGRQKLADVRFITADIYQKMRHADVLPGAAPIAPQAPAGATATSTLTTAAPGTSVPTLSTPQPLNGAGTAVAAQLSF